jgi:hypothetical protein
VDVPLDPPDVTHPLAMILLRPKLLLILTGASLLTGVSAASPLRAQGRDTLDVLFIGNSYVYYNNLADQLEGISAAFPDGPFLRTAHHLHGGFTLLRHIGDGHLPGVVDRGGPDNQPWDIVVIQEHSRLGVEYADEETGRLGTDRSFRDGLAAVMALVRPTGASVVLYQTWAKAAWPLQAEPLAAAYDRAGRDYGVRVVPAGRAWATVRERYPEFELFHPDGSHPSPAGSYLVASVFYATLAGRSPVGAPGRLDGIEMETPGVVVSDVPVTLVDLDPHTAGALQRAALAAVQAEESVPRD